MTGLFTTTGAIVIGIYITIISVFLAFLYRMYKDYRNHKLALRIIGLYNKTKDMTMRECYEARHLIGYAEGKVSSVYTTNALIFVRLREKQLAEQGVTTHDI
jgi:hypothetical protein